MPESKFKANRTFNSGWKNDSGNYSAIMNFNLDGDKRKKTSIKGKSWLLLTFSIGRFRVLEVFKRDNIER